MLEAAFLMRSVLKAQSCLCTCKVKGCSELNWELVMELVFVMLHTEFLLHWGLLYSFFWSLDVGWLWLYNYQKVRGMCRGWEGCIKMKIPFSVLMEVFCSNSSIFCRVYCWREAQKVVHEGELHLQAAELLHKNWPGLCDLVSRALHAAVPISHILP